MSFSELRPGNATQSVNARVVISKLGTCVNGSPNVNGILADSTNVEARFRAFGTQDVAIAEILQKDKFFTIKNFRLIPANPNFKLASNFPYQLDIHYSLKCFKCKESG